MTINQSLTQEIKQKEEQFRQKMGLLEVELKRFMQDSQSRTQQVSQEEVSRVQSQYEERIVRYRQELADKDSQLEKLRHQNAELTKEMVDATNEAGQCKNEVRMLRDKIKKAQTDVAQMEAQLQLKDQEVADQRNEQYQLLHKNKVE